MEIGLVGMLRAAWMAGIMPIVIASLPYSRLGLFHGVVLEFAKRGKIKQSSSHYKFTVPQRFFSHFYVVAVIWTTFLLLTMWIYASLVSEPYFYSNVSSHLPGGSNIFPFLKLHFISTERSCDSWLSMFLLLLMEVQVLRRLLETIYVFNYNPSARMHIFGYLAGLFFYVAAPLSLSSACVADAFIFSANEVTRFIFKGKGSMRATEFDWWDFVNPLMKLGWCQWFGAAIFFFGWIHQLRCHAILGSLRKHGRRNDEYVIPCGDWFDIVSSPHYLAEIVIYAGMVFASEGADLTIWLLFAFVVANLVFAAAETHRNPAVIFFINCSSSLVEA
ncbi:polyprenol reductase 2 isoform X2 [Manihot esculenta]|uniref:Uncharacterized protein n=2 Tax=Manihot esculenta TaxID=3983 RepID=A0ACB7HSY6_MANES|nr:polyprenol reductase 2 isoform X2 [Manihot esculenta]KAG8655746.1 hypothetical protein MANES_04G064400v8 [Manihot esculenta]KAG8655747.1 hypothetical protein MANES_04G064400v8 [Manihot esculenta]